jgi:hypothetical protein
LGAHYRKALRDQLAHVDFAAFKNALLSGAKMPDGLMPGTSLAALAFMMAAVALRDGAITDHQFETFTSEVIGALDGKDSGQRASECMRDIVDDTLGPPPLKDGEDDPSEVNPSAWWNGELGELNGTECKVRIVHTATGYALVRKDDETEITELRSLTEADLEKVKREDREDCRYVNLRARDGDILSCLIVGSHNEVIVSRRAFWWDLAKVSVTMMDVRDVRVRMTEHALARVHNAARGLWDTVVERARSIDELRDEPMYARNIHLNAMSKVIEECEHEADKLGLKICEPMVLAVQAEDDKLEAAAYQCFKRYLWRPGEEPREFHAHDAPMGWNDAAQPMCACCSVICHRQRAPGIPGAGFKRAQAHCPIG